tara:strand:+ start:850 stop:1545 length:696 start_codon:yes stop_codon:yes gene_type:complete
MEILMVRFQLKKDKINDFLKEMILDAEGSVSLEPGCRRFDIIQDEEVKSNIALCEVYNDQDAIDDHLTRNHFIEWESKSKDWIQVEPEVYKCKPVFPQKDAKWDSLQNNAAVSNAFVGGLYVIHAKLIIKEDKVDDFIEAITLDAIGSVNEEQGCLRFDVFQDKEKSNQLFLYEVYTNQSAFLYHTNTPHIKKWTETVKDWYDPNEKNSVIKGKNIWPPDNWRWSSGNPVK